MLQSLKPTLASEKVLVSGGLSMARAVVSDGLRSGPYQGFARAAVRGLLWWPPAAWAVRQGLTLPGK